MLYIHPPMNESSCDYPLIPAGIPGIMNMVKDTGGEGVNIPLEMMLDKRFNIESFLKKKDLSVVFVDLHWYVHSFGALYCADICKQIFPESFVILGGMTSSVFAYEVLQHSSVDGIIQGDSEEAVRDIMAGKPKKEISNFIYRENNAIKKSTKWYTINQEDYDSLDFSRYDWLKNEESYLKTDLDGVHKETIKSVWLEVGRGCTFNCSVCGGGKNAHFQLFGRNTPIYRSGSKIAEDILNLAAQGVNRIAPTHDYTLLPEKVKETVKDTIRKEKIEIGILNEFWVAPYREDIKKMCNIFEPALSRFHISCETGNERVRLLNFPGKNTNKEYMKSIEEIELHEVFCEIFFAANLPFETRETWNDTVKFLKNMFKPEDTKAYFCCAVTLDPLSPLWVNPAQYKVTLEMTKFADYMEMCRGDQRVPGFESAFLSEEDVYKNLEMFQHVFE
jgi:radical SAM superfamily enzyme YgiQ (UPF0313 family)